MFRVLVFPSSNEPGLEVVEALRRSNKVELLGGSSIGATHDPSRHLLRHHLEIPSIHDSAFDTAFRTLLAEHRVDAVFATIDPLVARLSEWRIDGVRFITPRAEVARMALSKRATYAAVEGVAETPRLVTTAESGLPAFAKPDAGSGGRGARLVSDARDLAAALGEGLLVTEYLPGLEYTVDCVGDATGRLLGFNVRERALIGRSISLGTRGHHDPDIDAAVARIADRLRIAGPWFAQFKRRDDGTPVLLEINTRVAGSMAHTRLAGLNIPLMSLFSFMGYSVRAPVIRGDFVLNRSLRNHGDVSDFDLVVWDLDDTILRKDGKADPEVVARLLDLHNQGRRQVLLTLNPDPERAMAAAFVPRLFAEVVSTDDKLRELAPLLERHGAGWPRTIAVNDSYSERLAMESAYPELRVLSPDALDLLARERLG
jgi:hypothetical protein